jgi:hypothetical protein
MIHDPGDTPGPYLAGGVQDPPGPVEAADNTNRHAREGLVPKAPPTHSTSSRLRVDLNLSCVDYRRACLHLTQGIRDLLA